MAKTFPLSDQTYSKQKISIFQHFLTTMFCKKKVTQNAGPPECSVSRNARNHNSKFEFVLGPPGPERACCYVRVIQVSQLISSDHASITFSNENPVSGHDLLVS